MAKNTVADLDTTAANNTDVAANGIAGSDSVSGGDNVIRALAAMIKKWWNDLSGQVTVGGTANAITITSSNPASYQSLVSGIRLLFTPGADGTGAATLNLDAIAAKAVRKMSAGSDIALTGYELLAGRRAEVVYDSTANSAAGGWILLNPATPEFYNSDAGATAGPIVDLYRNSASPAANDIIGELDFNGQNSTPAKKTFTRIRTRIDDATAASEDATLSLAAMKAGTLTDYLTLGANAAGTAAANALGMPLGQLSFPAAQNASSDVNTLDDYEEGTFTPTILFGGASVGITYTTQNGWYQKVGRFVFVAVDIVLSSKGSSTGNATLTGLPFAVAASQNYTAPGGFFGNLTSVTVVPIWTLDAGGSGGSLFQASGALTNANFANNSAVRFSGTYGAAN